ncbi:MAG: hypothetical protein JSS35_12070 [Proteobacteria bacterium]|nr:hypothetical protein [Pseudomonadota bacterium]
MSVPLFWKGQGRYFTAYAEGVAVGTVMRPVTSDLWVYELMGGARDHGARLTRRGAQKALEKIWRGGGAAWAWWL